MKRPTSQRGRVWFWVGAALLFISALCWLIIILIIAIAGDGAVILVGVLFTAIPIGVGIFCLRRGRRGLGTPKSGEPKRKNNFWDMFDWLLPTGLVIIALVAAMFAIAEENWILAVISVVAVSAAVYWAYALARRGKVAFQKGEQLIQRLQELGVRAAWSEPGTEERRIGEARLWGRRSEGVIKIADRSIAYVSIMSNIDTRNIHRRYAYGLRYFFDYLIRCSVWQGGKRELAPDVWILPERKHGYVKIRTPDILPSADFFSQLDTIAGRINSGAGNTV